MPLSGGWHPDGARARRRLTAFRNKPSVASPRPWYCGGSALRRRLIFRRAACRVPAVLKASSPYRRWRQRHESDPASVYAASPRSDSCRPRCRRNHHYFRAGSLPDCPRHLRERLRFTLEWAHLVCRWHGAAAALSRSDVLAGGGAARHPSLALSISPTSSDHS